jgi:hypothetical protein
MNRLVLLSRRRVEARLGCCFVFLVCLGFLYLQLDTIARVCPLDNVPPVLCAISRQGSEIM